MWGTLQTITDQSIHNQLRALHLGDSASLGHTYVHPLYNFELMSGDRGRVSSGMGHNDLYLGTPGVQSTRAHQRATAIATRSSQDYHLFATRIAIGFLSPRRLASLSRFLITSLWRAVYLSLLTCGDLRLFPCSS